MNNTLFSHKFSHSLISYRHLVWIIVKWLQGNHKYKLISLKKSVIYLYNRLADIDRVHFRAARKNWIRIGQKNRSWIRIRPVQITLNLFSYFSSIIPLLKKIIDIESKFYFVRYNTTKHFFMQFRYSYFIIILSIDIETKFEK